MNVLDRLVSVGFSLAMKVLRQRLWPNFQAAAKHPERTQTELLRRILATNASTTFGQSHGFGRIATAAEFRSAVPVQDYPSLQPFIEDQERNGTPALTVEPPALYAQTSGTSGSPKYLPITQSGIERISRAQRLFSTMVAAETDMFTGKIVGIGSPAVEGHLPGGTPFGSASGMVYEGMPGVVQSKYVIGPHVLAIKDHDLRYLAIAALCLAEREVTGVATANPSTLLRLHSIINERFDDLLAAVEGHPLPGTAELAPEQRTELTQALPGDAQRAEALRQLRSEFGDAVTYAHIWPRLAAITTWTGGSCGYALRSLEPLLAANTRIVELGYSASEVRGAIGIDPQTNKSALLLTDNFFEFVDRETRDSSAQPPGAHDFLGLHELVDGGEYYIYITTLDGLYRYDMNDVVKVTGWFEKTPCIAFVQKGRGVTNITGEKLTESQVLTAVAAANQDLGVTAPFFVALADEEAACYRLYIDHTGVEPVAAELAALVDDKLGALNIEYQSKRASGRLGPMQGVDLASGTGDAYREDRVRAGQRDAQFKYLQLQNLADCDFDFDAHERPRASL